MTLNTPRKAGTVDAGHPQPAFPIRRCPAKRLGLHSPLNLRDGVTITRHHLNHYPTIAEIIGTPTDCKCGGPNCAHSGPAGQP